MEKVLFFFFLLWSFQVQGEPVIDFGIPYISHPVSSERPNLFSYHHHIKRGEVLDGFTKLDYNVEIIDNLVNLRDVEGIKQVACSSDSLRIHFSEGTNEPVWSKGFTLVGGSSFGCKNEEGRVAPFYRTIQSIEREGDSFVVQTRSKNALDCFKFAKISFKHEPGTQFSKRIDYFGPESGSSSVNLFSWNYNSGSDSASQALPIWQTGGQVGPGKYAIDVKCSNCYAYLSAGISWEIYINSNWGFPRIEHFKVVVGGTAAANVEVTASASYSFNLAKEITILNERNIGHFEIPVGPVPVEVTAAVELDAKAQMTFGAKGVATAGVGYSKTVSAGLEYRSDWGEIREIPISSTRNLQFQTPSFTIGANSDIKVTLIPKLILKLYNVIPFYLKLEPYIGSKLAIGDGSGCSSRSDLHYQLYSGLDAVVGLDPISFSIFGFASVSLGKSVGLPIDKEIRVIPQTDLSCSSCSGCLSLGKRSTSFYWTKSEWSSCSVPCGGGVQNRTVNCIQGNTLVPDASCSHFPKPSGERECNSHQCPTTICSAKSNCADCVDNAHCGWCESTRSCLPQGSTCDSGFTFYHCPLNEAPIVINYPIPGTQITDQEILHVNWTGGSDHVFIVFTWDLASGWFCPGIDSNYLENKGSYEFGIHEGYPASSNYRLAVVSFEDPTNYAVVDGITVSSQSSNHNFWAHSGWTACSSICEEGTQVRIESCHNPNGTIVDNSLCVGIPETHSRPCRNDFACKYFPLKVRNIKLGQLIQDPKYELKWSGGKEGDDLKIEFRKVGSENWDLIAPSTPNTGQFIWSPASEEGLFELRLTSNTSPNNTVISKTFALTKKENSLASSQVYMLGLILFSLFVSLN